MVHCKQLCPGCGLYIKNNHTCSYIKKHNMKPKKETKLKVVVLPPSIQKEQLMLLNKCTTNSPTIDFFNGNYCTYYKDLVKKITHEN